MKVCVGVKSTKFGEPWDGNTEPSIGSTTYKGVETRYWNLLKEYNIPKKSGNMFGNLDIYYYLCNK